MDTARKRICPETRHCAIDEHKFSEKSILRRSVVRLILIGIVLLSPRPALSQIPNAGFEDWQNGFPDGWVVNNLPPTYETITPIGYSHSGARALVGTVVSSTVGITAPSIHSGPNGAGFACGERPASFHGWYMFNPAAGGDCFSVNACLYKGGTHGTLVASAAAADGYWGSAWQEFVAPFSYRTDDIPDTAVVTVMILHCGSGGTSAPHVGSSFRLDDLSFVGGTLSVPAPENVPLSMRLYQNYPNPCNPTTEIRYQISAFGNVTLGVYDLLGREVAVLVDERKMPGTYEARFDGSHLPGGVYFYRMQVRFPDARDGADTHVQTMKLALVK